MNLVSQIIGRNLHRRESCGAGLWINPGNDDRWKQVNGRCVSLQLLSHDYGTYCFLKQTGASVEFSAFPQAVREKYQWIILNLPRQKALLQMLLDCAANLLAEDGVLWLAGENKAGIKSADKLLKSTFAYAGKLDNARHCTLYEAHPPLEQQLFNPADYCLEWGLKYDRTGVNVSSYPGVFAHGRLDAGTALLLDALAGMNLEGDILDFGCGAGLLGAYIAKRHPQTRVTLIDNNALAIRACRETLAANALNCSLLASDGFSALKTSFDLVVSNPPIHAGVKTDSKLGMRLLEQAYDHINPGGRLVMVANVHLPYQNRLARKFKHCSQLMANNSYKIILARK